MKENTYVGSTLIRDFMLTTHRNKPRGKESTEVRKSQIKGKESEVINENLVFRKKNSQTRVRIQVQMRLFSLKLTTQDLPNGYSEN